MIEQMRKESNEILEHILAVVEDQNYPSATAALAKALAVVVTSAKERDHALALLTLIVDTIFEQVDIKYGFENVLSAARRKETH